MRRHALRSHRDDAFRTDQSASQDTLGFLLNWSLQVSCPSSSNIHPHAAPTLQPNSSQVPAHDLDTETSETSRAFPQILLSSWKRNTINSFLPTFSDSLRVLTVCCSQGLNAPSKKNIFQPSGNLSLLIKRNLTEHKLVLRRTASQDKRFSVPGARDARQRVALHSDTRSHHFILRRPEIINFFSRRHLCVCEPAVFLGPHRSQPHKLHLLSSSNQQTSRH